jgi:hypothetical protein
VSKQAYKRLRKALNLPVNRQPLPSQIDGYPVWYGFVDGGCCCAECVDACIDLIDEANKGERYTRAGQIGSWAIDRVEPNWEVFVLHCDHCGQVIPCAYSSTDALPLDKDGKPIGYGGG